MTSLRITGFDHLVLRCADVDETLAWYVDTLGLAAVRVDEWRRGAVPFPSLRVGAETKRKRS
jgi:catechol 2,3-dioxygenase-like lactoylglutathione lyase family enzyme